MEFVTRQEALEQSLKRYFTGKPCKHGHVCERFVSDGKCVECVYERNHKYHEENLEVLKKYNHKYYVENREGKQKYDRKYRAQNLKAKQEYDRKYCVENRKAIRERKRKIADGGMCTTHAKTSAFTKGQCETCTIRNRIRSLNRQIFKNRGLCKSQRTQELTGCSSQDLYQHLIQTFHRNYPNSVFCPEANLHLLHIDHVRPVASFDLFDPEQLKQCCHYSNLQLLWGRENLEKSDRVVTLPLVNFESLE